MKQLESKLEQDCVKFARTKCIATVKLENNGHKGIPDRIFIKKGGDCLFVEFKNPNGKGVISTEQQHFANFLEKKHAFINSVKDFIELDFFK